MKRFWNKVNICGPTECWNWMAATDWRYGHFRLDGSIQKAHRVAYKLYHGTIDETLDVLHKCDNTLCINPAHLEQGTHSLNMQQKVLRGRARVNPQVGAERYNSKLTSLQVMLMRTMYEIGMFRVGQLARLFGISQPTVSQILNRTTWTHI